MPTQPNSQQQQQAPLQSQLQNQLYHYSSDNELSQGNASTVSGTEYDYKESYSYAMNPPSGGVQQIGSSSNAPTANNQAEQFSPVNTNLNLAAYSNRSQQQNQHQPPISGTIAVPNTTMYPQSQLSTSSSSYPSLSQIPYEHTQPQYFQTQINSQPPSGQGHPSSSVPPPQPLFVEEFKTPKGHSLPDIRPSTYTYDDEPSKYRANSCPLNPYQNPLHSQQYPNEPQPYQHGQQNVLSIQVPQGIDVNQYPDMTTLLNSNSNLLPPPVESQFVDHKSCQICGKRITRDMSRHMRTHQSEARFKCKFPKSQCRHKLGKFNRPYDYKKHLLNRHFKFDDPCVKRLHNLSDKLFDWGTCPCGLRFMGKDWLDKHILTEDNSKKCPIIE